MQPLILVAIIFATMNSALLVGLLYLYARIQIKTHAKYTIGLMIFAALLLVHNLITASSYFFMGGFFGWQVYPLLDAITISEFAALIVLFKVTL
ncbi:MAG: hypothetical protein OK455_07660 [Thaumarchaeota archaeon]|nr:hypothetical protein [Nitrososphaerota archaeon]